MEGGRLALLLAVLEKRLGLRLGDRDVFLNVAGGLAVDEPALDLAAAAAVVSSFREIPLAEDLVLFGEVGLLGEIRTVPRPDERLREAVALGFRRCAVPASSPGSAVPGMTVVPMDTITDVVDLLTA
jgi:DNA repair protein RadA/Sms